MAYGVFKWPPVATLAYLKLFRYINNLIVCFTINNILFTLGRVFAMNQSSG